MKNIGFCSFYLGIFLLPSAFSISAALLLIASFIGFFINKNRLLDDRLNHLFFIGIMFLFISSIFNSINSTYLINENFSNPLTKHIGLFNWIPMILSFYGFQPYLESERMRKNTCLFFIFGTFPVFVSILGQAFFEWHGPLTTLNGLITWYQRPLNDGITRITGLFNNQNYLGSWLILIWPFCLALFFKKEKFFINKVIVFIFLILTSVSIILCASRAAWLALALSLPILLGFKSTKIILPIIFFSGITLLLIFVPIFGEGFQIFIQNIIPKGIWDNFNSQSYGVHLSRIDLWKNAIEIISKNPLFGTGASSFPALIENNTGIWSSHPHSLPFELMVSYGIPATIFIISPFTIIICLAYFKTFIRNKINFNESIFDKAWLTSLILLTIANLVDMTYFDGRISIAGWTLLAGARNITLKKNI